MNNNALSLIASLIILAVVIWYTTKNITESFSANKLGALSQTTIDQGSIITSNPAGTLKSVSLYNMVFPPKTILMWNSLNTDDPVPEGWALCDGNNGTPDMTYKFPIGFNSDDSKFDTLGKTGGSDTHTLTENEIPGHNHKVSTISNSNKPSVQVGTAAISCLTSDYWGEQTTGTTGSGTSHSNMPPYYVIKFIMKL